MKNTEHQAHSRRWRDFSVILNTLYSLKKTNRTEQNNNITAGLDCFTREFFQKGKEEILTNLHRISLNIEGKEILSTSFYEVSMTYTPVLEKHIKKEENLGISTLAY